MTNHTVKVGSLVERMKLKNLTPDVPYEERKIVLPDINRPALQMAGFFEHFSSERIQIVGYVEHTYTDRMDPKQREEVYETFFSYDIPCVIFCRNIEPAPILLEIASKHGIPIFQTPEKTSAFSADLIRWLNEELAPCISIHGVLIDVYGIGVLMMGESGIGKSEAALELIKRGHRLVSDDVVEIRKISDDTLIGTAPSITKHFIELRGIGIVDVKTLFGVQSVRESQTIDMVITLEDWNKDKEYDRLGMEEQHTDILGNQVVCHQLPIRPGRNLAIIVETAAINHRQKQMGYNAAQELYRRVQESMTRR